jgi:hypothetical protein
VDARGGVAAKDRLFGSGAVRHTGKTPILDAAVPARRGGFCKLVLRALLRTRDARRVGYLCLPPKHYPKNARTAVFGGLPTVPQQLMRKTMEHAILVYLALAWSLIPFSF